MSEKEFRPVHNEEHDKIAKLKAKKAELDERIAHAEFMENQSEKFGRDDVTAPNEGEDTYSSYLAQRPENGIVRDFDGFRDTATGHFASEVDYNEQFSNTADYYYQKMGGDNQGEYVEPEYESMGQVQLAREAAKAEALGDRVLVKQIRDIAYNNVMEEATRPGGDDWTQEQVDAQMAAFDRYVDRFNKAEQPETTKPADTSSTPEAPASESEIADKPSADSETSVQSAKENEPIVVDTLDDVELVEVSKTDEATSPAPEAKRTVDTLDDVELVDSESVDESSDDASREKAKRWDNFRHPLAYLSGRLAERSQRVRDHYNEKYVNGDEERYKKKQRILLGATIGVAALAAAYIFRDQIGDTFNNIFGGNHHDINQFNGGSGNHPSATPNHDGAMPTPSPSGHEGATPTPPPSEVGAPVLHTPEASLYSSEYPWDWAKDAFPGKNEMTELHRLTDIAQAHGHVVEWLPARGGGQYIQIDGNSNTVAVLNILRPYAG